MNETSRSLYNAHIKLSTILPKTRDVLLKATAEVKGNGTPVGLLCGPKLRDQLKKTLMRLMKHE